MLSDLQNRVLSHQGLLLKQPFGKGKVGVRKAIEHLGFIQIDTLSVVERAHHHILWSRVPGYKTQHLNQLVADKKIFEYWFHAASYLPMGDYRFALPQMESVRKGEHRYYKNVDSRLMNKIILRIRNEGPLRLRDFEGGKSTTGASWANGPGKRAFEKLFMQGDIMVSERIGMEKVFDLAERCLPDGIDQSLPGIEEYAAYLFQTTCRSQGVFTWKQLLHLKTGKPMRDAMEAIVDNAIASATLDTVKLADGQVLYLDVSTLKAAKPSENRVKILSPFDNAVIHRDRLSSLFSFDFRIECYLPAAKRTYGYFCLPILYGNQFVARIDCKAHRSKKTLEVLSLHLESEGQNAWPHFRMALLEELQKFAEFNQCHLLNDDVIQTR